MLVILTSALSSRLTRYCNWALFFGVARTTRSLNRKKKNIQLADSTVTKSWFLLREPFGTQGTFQALCFKS